MSEPGPPSTPSESVVTISTQLMVAAVIFLFMVVVFIFFLYLYAKNYLRSNPSLRRSRTRLIFTAAAEQTPLAHRGLDAQLLKSLPVTIFNPSDFKDGLECAVCLSEISQGEEIRLLPKCSHGFHVACIDMWFHSHTTCPLCRSPVTGEAEAVEEVQPQELIFPTNVLFWGNQELVSNGVQTQVAGSEVGTSSSSSSKRPEGSLVIDIPRRAMEEFVSPMASLSPMEEMKTPKSARLRSLRRLLSRGKMVIGASYSPKGSDIEQGAVVGEGSSLAPKTPTRK